MWKDFFYYSKSERRVILLLLASLLAGTGTTFFLRNFHTPEVKVQDMEGADSFLTNLKETRPGKYKPIYRNPEKITKALVDFDPNLADSATFRRLGLPAFIAHNILRYRAKGGVFRTPESFSKIYGLRPEQYEELKPYLFISEKFQKKENLLQTDIRRDSSATAMKYAEGVVIDLNPADTNELKRIPGIGSGIARMIVTYRERLGGFHAVDQLAETGYVPEESFRWFAVRTPLYRKLEVNQAGLDRLRNHPYMDFYKAKAILEYRRKRGKIKSLSQLALFEEFTERDLKRLSPYLSFD